MARFQTVERPSETVTKLIQNSVAKLKNKEGRVKGRRSKGVPQGLLHQVLVKGVIQDLVKVVNKETRFPKEISSTKNNVAAAKGASPRLTSPKKSPKPKSWLSSSPTSNKRNLLRQELQTSSSPLSENDASAANSSATVMTPTKDTSPTGRSRLRSASPRRATVSQLSPANRRLNRSPSQSVNRSPIRTPSLKSTSKRVPLSPVSGTINASQNITSSASRTSLSSSSNASSSCQKFSRVASKAALIRRRVQKAEGAAGCGAVKRTAKRTRVAAAGMQRGLTGNRVVGTVKRLKRR